MSTSCTIITTHFESLPFLRAWVREVRKQSNPDVNHHMLILEQSGEDTCVKVFEEFGEESDITIVKTASLWAGYGKDYSLRYCDINTEYVCFMDNDAYPISDRWLLLPIKLIEEEGFNFAGQLHFISDGKEPIYPPAKPFFSMSPTFSVMRTELAKELALNGGFTRFHNRPFIDVPMCFKDHDWHRWAWTDYISRGSDDDVTAYWWGDQHREDNKIGLRATHSLGMYPEETGYGRIIGDVLFHFGFSCESKNVMDQMGDNYRNWTKRINEGFTDELLQEMIEIARQHPIDDKTLVWDGKTKVASTATEELEKRIEILKTRMPIVKSTWTPVETKKFQMTNEEHLADINTSLKPDEGLVNLKLGVFCPGQVGDMGCTMGILKYTKELFPKHQIIWFVNTPNCELLRFASISEVRPYPWGGAGLPEGTPDFYPMLCDENNRLNLELASKYDLTKDLTDGVFPTPWMMSPEKRHGTNYPEISKKVFGVPGNWEWHPVLKHSPLEMAEVNSFIKALPEGRIVCIESFVGSGQSKINEEMIEATMKMCEEQWGKCNFIFMSHKYLNGQEQFPDGFFKQNIVSAAQFTPRVCALIGNYCDLFISASSGTTVMCCAWNILHFPSIQYCGSVVCGLKEIANGEMIQVFSDDRPKEEAEAEYAEKLREILTKYK